MNPEIAQSPFFQTEVFGHNPFERHGDVYRMNPTAVTVEKVLELLSDEEKSFLKSDKPEFFSIPKDRMVIVGIIDKVYDDPLLGGVVAEVTEAEEAAKKVNDFLVDMNGIEFHREYYQFMVKEMYEKMLTTVTGGKVTHPDQLDNDDFCYTFTINFFAKYILDEKSSTTGERVKFFEKVFQDMNAFDCLFLGDGMPEDRTNMHFLVWEK